MRARQGARPRVNTSGRRPTKEQGRPARARRRTTTDASRRPVHGDVGVDFEVSYCNDSAVVALLAL